MAEPARELNPYDPESEQNSGYPDLHTLEGGNPAGASRPGKNPFKVVKPDEEEEEAETGQPGLKVLEGNPNATPEADSTKPKLSVVGGQNDTTPQPKKQNFLAKIPGSAAFKRRAAFAGALVVAGVISAVIGFFSLLPLKIIHIVTNMQQTFSATARHMLLKETDKIFEGYMRNVIRSVINGQCTTTIDKDCTVGVAEKGPLGKLYKTWHDRRLEKILAEMNDGKGLIVGKRGNVLYATFDGVDIANDSDLRAVANGDKRFFDIVKDKRNRVSPTKLRQQIDFLLKDATFLEKAHFRFRFNGYFKERGVKLCVIACKINDKYLYPLKDRILSAKATFMGRVLTPIDEETGLLFECVMNGSCDDLNELQKMTPEELERTTPIEQKVRVNLLEGASEEDVAKLVAKTDAAATQSFTDALLDASVRKLVGLVASDAVASQAGKLTTKLIPIAGWALLAAQLETAANQIGPAFHKITFAINSAAAEQMFALYASVAAEQKSGHTDPAEFGSYMDALATNLSGSKDDRVDITESCAYDFFFTSKDNPHSGPGLPICPKYHCNDGSNVPGNTIRCAEEVLNQGNILFDAISFATNLFPWQPFFAGIANKVNILIGEVTGPVLNAAFEAFCNATPGCTDATKQAEGKIAEFSQWLIFKLVASPFSGNMSGARIGDMMMAGADHANNQDAQMAGGMKLPDQTVALIRSEELASDKADFESQTLFARVFNTSSPYSLVSRMAVAMPTSLPLAINSSLATITSPLSHLTNIFSSIFVGDKAFAAIPAQPDPWGITQYGIPDDDPVYSADPVTYLNQRCPGMGENDFNGDLDAAMGKIRADWENQAAQDDNGETLTTTTQPCLLIGQAIQDSGVMFDTSFAPHNTLTPDPTE